MKRTKWLKQYQQGGVLDKSPETIKKMVYNKYPILDKAIPINEAHVNYAQGNDLNILRQYHHNPEYISAEEGAYKTNAGVPISKNQMWMEGDDSHPVTITNPYPGQYTTVMDTTGKSQQQLIDMTAGDFVSHGLHNLPAYNILTDKLGSQLNKQYGQHVKSEGGVDAYVRAMMNPKEYPTYQKEMPVDTVYTNPVMRFINQKQQGGKISTQGYKESSKDKNAPWLTIPSNQITMQGVDHPVMAYPSAGSPQMMYPGQEYQFPGSQYVQEVPVKMEGGGPAPFVTSDPEIYKQRKQAYDDSDAAYNAGENQYNFGKKIYDDVRKPMNADFRNFHTIQEEHFPLIPYTGTNGNNIMPISSYSEKYVRKPKTLWQSTFGSDNQDKYYIDEKGNHWEDVGIGWQRFQQPMQKVEYNGSVDTPVSVSTEKKLPKRKLHTKQQISSTPISGQEQLPTQQSNYQPQELQNIEYPSQFGHHYFEPTYGTSRTVDGKVDVPIKKSGGWLSQYQDGGGIGYTNMSTRVQPVVNAPVIPAPSWGAQYQREHPEAHIGPAVTYNTPDEQRTHDYFRDKMYQQEQDERANREFAGKLKAPSELAEKIIDAGTAAEGAEGIVKGIGSVGKTAGNWLKNYGAATAAKNAKIASEIKRGNDWLKDWYNNPEIKERVAENNKTSIFKSGNNEINVVSPNFYDKLTKRNIKNGDLQGDYNPITGKAIVYSKNPENIALNATHEGTHQFTNGEEGLSKQNTELLSNIIDAKKIDKLKKSGTLTKDELKYINYLTEPTEIHARLNELRMHYNLLPDDITTTKEASNIIKDIQEGKTSLDPDFGNMIMNRPSQFAEALNKMFSPIGIGAGIGAAALPDNKQMGGVIKKQSNWLSKY